MKYLIPILLFLTITSCKEKEMEDAPSIVDGEEINNCGVRAADGRGPYEFIDRVSKENCEYQISLKCQEQKYRQVHRIEGYFARGKYGNKIIISTCK